MNAHRLLVLATFSFSLASAALTGCAAEPASEEESAVSEDEIRSGLLGDVAAVRTVRSQPGAGEATFSVAKATKVRKVLRAFGLSGATIPPEGSPRCFRNPDARSYEVEFLSKTGATLGHASLSCEGDGRSTGTLRVGSKVYVASVDSAELDAVNAEPRTVGETLFGATRATLNKLGDQRRAFVASEPAAVAAVIAAAKPAQIPDENGSSPRCPPTEAVVFYRGETEIAHALIVCGAGERGEVVAKLATGEHRLGDITVDLGALRDAFGDTSR